MVCLGGDFPFGSGRDGNVSRKGGGRDARGFGEGVGYIGRVRCEVDNLGTLPINGRGFKGSLG